MAIRVVMGATVTPEVDGLVGNVSRSWCTPLGLGATGPPCKHADKPQLSIGRAHGPRSADPQPTGVSAVDITLRAEGIRPRPYVTKTCYVGNLTLQSSMSVPPR